MVLHAGKFGCRRYIPLLLLCLTDCSAPCYAAGGASRVTNFQRSGFVSQRRVGLNGKLFTIYKFRSMVVDAEAATGAVWATRNDPRVTSIGGFMRRTRLDELPQLFNVLRGDMAIVGPRPERPEFVSVLSEQIPFYRQRHSVKPGVTGWAQINYKYGETVEDTIIKLEYDLYYIKNLSPTLDVYIIFDTAKVMLFSSHGQ
ncbi:MAG: sugar transferase [Bryobacteraceae bacterium]